MDESRPIAARAACCGLAASRLKETF